MCKECIDRLLWVNTLVSQDAVGVKSPDVDGILNIVMPIVREITPPHLREIDIEIIKDKLELDLKEALSRVWYTTPKKITEQQINHRRYGCHSVEYDEDDDFDKILKDFLREHNLLEE